MLPSKKVLPMIYLLFILILIYLIFNNFKKSSDLSNLQKRITEGEKIKVMNDIGDKDTDGDGLKDWQEVLYKTDKELVDTDNDGKTDFEEVKLGEDPLVYGQGKIGYDVDVIKTQQVVSNIEEQKKDFERYKEVLREREKEKFELYLKKQKKELTLAEKEYLKEIKQESKRFTEDLNNMGDVLVSKGHSLQRFDRKIFNKLFTVKTNNVKKQKILESDYIHINEKILLMKKVVNELNNLNLVTSEIEGFKQDLSKAYKLMSDNLAIILKSDGPISRDVFKGYVDGTLLQVKTRKYINYFIVENKLSLNGSGSYFKYEL